MIYQQRYLSKTGAYGRYLTPNYEFVDLFSIDSTGDYTESNGGGAGSWTITAGSLTGANGTHSIFVPTAAISSINNIILVRLTRSDDGGILLRQSTNNYYLVKIFDASSSVDPNKIKLYKVVSGTLTQLGGDITISFTRGNPFNLQFIIVGDSLQVVANGSRVLIINDFSLTTGTGFGFYNNGAANSIIIDEVSAQFAPAVSYTPGFTFSFADNNYTPGFTFSFA